MFCTQLKRVDFAVNFGNVCLYHYQYTAMFIPLSIPLYVETVTYDENFWQQILPRIEFLFRRAVVPELFTRRVQRGEKLYQHGGWKNR